MKSLGSLFTRYLQKKRIDLAKKYLYGDVLDIGCGSASEDIIRLLNSEQKYVGIDLNLNADQEKKLSKMHQNHRFFSLNLECDNIPTNDKFDTILMLAFIEHLKDPSNMLRQCYNLLKDDGKMIITTPTPFGNKIHSFLSIFGLTSKSAVEHHEHIYSYKAIKDLLQDFGFSICQYKIFELGANQIICAEKEQRASD